MPGNRRNYKKKNGKRNGKKPNTIRNRLKKVETKLKNIKPEFKYIAVGAYKYDGQSTNMTASFYSNETGAIKSMSPRVLRGTAYNNRIGDTIQLKRIFATFVVRWPLFTLTPNWNGRNAAAISNAELYSRDLRLTCPCKISVIQMEHADRAFAAFQTYLEGFKRLYTLKENMVDNAVKDLKSQELKVLSSKSFTLRRKLTTSGPASELAATYTSSPAEISINIPMNQKLTFPTDPSTDYLPSNYRYAYVIQFGHMADQFLTIDDKYNPLVQAKFNYWYTDS